MKVHQRSVNRISWNLDSAFTLISGSQDSTVKLWDTRSGCEMDFTPNSQSVRDVEFNQCVLLPVQRGCGRGLIHCMHLVPGTTVFSLLLRSRTVVCRSVVVHTVVAAMAAAHHACAGAGVGHSQAVGACASHHCTQRPRVDRPVAPPPSHRAGQRRSRSHGEGVGRRARRDDAPAGAADH